MPKTVRNKFNKVLSYENLKNGTYTHGVYTTFYVSEPKLRKIEKARYMDRIVHRWLVDYIIEDFLI